MTDSYVYMKERIYTPGPTPLSEEARMAGAMPAEYHRTEAFAELLHSCRKRLAPLFGTKELPIILTSSGTGAMESCLASFTSAGDSILVIEAGKFGNRWYMLGETYECNVDRMVLEWGSTFEYGSIEQKLRQNPAIKAVFIQANETSTGVHHNIEQLAKEVRAVSKETLIIVDAISSICAHKCEMDAWDLDCVISGSQKGFGVPPGLAFVAVSQRAWSKLSKRPRFYFDLEREKKGQDAGKTAWTPANGLMHMLDRALDHIHNNGVAAVINHHRKSSIAVRKAIDALELPLFAKDHFSQALTAVRIDQEGLAPVLLKTMKKDFRMIFAGGQDHLKGKIIRIAHLGYFDFFDTLNAVAAFELALAKHGRGKACGKAVGAFMSSYTAD